MRVQGRRGLYDVLSLILTAVTYHELFKLAARDALATVATADYMELYAALAAPASGKGVAAEDRDAVVGSTAWEEALSSGAPNKNIAASSSAPSGSC